MSKQLDRYLETHPMPKSGGAQNQSPEERQALMTLRAEARQRGAELATGGKGGLPPSLVLNVFRRDKFRCHRCGKKKNLGIHHKGGLDNPNSEWLEKKGHSNDPNNLVVLCGTRENPGCHDDVHDEDRARGGE